MFRCHMWLIGANARQVEGEKMWDIFQAYATREQNLELTKDGLTEQLNRQNMNMHQMALELDNTRQALHTVDRRSREWENAFRESQRVQNQLGYQLQEERERHKKTSLELDFEFKEHAKTEKHLERHYVTLNRLSEFLTMVQVASKEERSEVMDKLNKEPHMGNLILEIEDKKQYIGNLEEKLKAAKVEFEKAVASHQDAIRLKELEIAELEGVASQDRLPELEHGMIEIIADLPGKKRARADRKSSKRQQVI